MPSPSAPRPTTSRPSRPCSAPCSSTTRRTIACRASSRRTTSSIPLHQQIYETASKLIASGKQATPITLKTFFENAEPIDATTHRAAVPRQARGQRHHHHQRARLRPHRPRPLHPPAADHDRRGRGQRRLRLPGRLPAQGADRGGRDAAVLARRDGQVRTGLPRLQPRLDHGHRTWPTTPTSATATCPASPPASAGSTARWAGCSHPT